MESDEDDNAPMEKKKLKFQVLHQHGGLLKIIIWTTSCVIFQEVYALGRRYVICINLPSLFLKLSLNQMGMQ